MRVNLDSGGHTLSIKLTCSDLLSGLHKLLQNLINILHALIKSGGPAQALNLCPKCIHDRVLVGKWVGVLMPAAVRRTFI